MFWTGPGELWYKIAQKAIKPVGVFSLSSFMAQRKQLMVDTWMTIEAVVGIHRHDRAEDPAADEGAQNRPQCQNAN
jgi:hypothetical protein